MIEKPRQDSSRDLLEELEEGWATPAAPFAVAKAPASATPKISEPSSPKMPSNPDIAAVDEGWLDDLFPGEEGGEGEGEGEDDEDDDDDDDEPEGELPDERLEPEAFALAKKARDDRAAGKKERKRAKAEAKRAKQKARAAATRQKQKSKKSRAAAAARPAPESRRSLRRLDESDGSATSFKPASPPASDEGARPSTSTATARPARAATSSTAPTILRRASTIGSLKLLAVVLAVLLALAAFAAAVLK